VGRNAAAVAVAIVDAGLLDVRYPYYMSSSFTLFSDTDRDSPDDEFTSNEQLPWYSGFLAARPLDGFDMYFLEVGVMSHVKDRCDGPAEQAARGDLKRRGWLVRCCFPDTDRDSPSVVRIE
jgi:hypothetical protein